MMAPSDSLRLLLEETGSTRRAVYPSDLISECFINVTLPQELITEILVRLPVKSLLRFKCVSKPWLSLISNPQFTRYYFSKSCLDEVENLHLQLLYATETSMKKCSLSSVLHEADPSEHVSAIGFPAKNYQAIVGIINGLVCLNLKGTDLCLWNPTLNKTKHLDFYPEAPSGRVDYIFSFGYEESNDDYKVVCMQTLARNDGVFYSEDTEVFIYSLKAGSWRRIDRLKCFYMFKPGVFANGKIYWIDESYAFVTRDGNLVSIDMLSEKLLEMQPPEYDAGDCVPMLEVSGGRLVVLCNYDKVRKVVLWVLNKHGVEESWCKLVSMPYTDVIHKTSFFNYRFLWITRNGEIVFGDKFGLLVYNWKKKEYREIELVVGIKSPWRVAAYVESLVWPDYA